MITQTVETVHIVFKTHLDMGFTDLARNVMARYVTKYIPAALDLAARFRAEGGAERYVWTTGSWLIYQYLEQAPAPQRARLEEAIAAGDIAWHGLPFTMHSELMDASLFRFGLSLSQALDARFGKQTIAAKMTDVPGHTRSIVPLLADAGIVLLHIGVNPASAPPRVPPVFRWQTPDGAEIVVLYQKGAYGDLMLVPGLSQALFVAHTNDNAGPHTADDVRAIFRRLRRRFPGATVVASTLDRFAAAVMAVRSQLPVITAEIGDTWIHGVGSDPAKVAQFRQLSRQRRAWLERGLAPEQKAAVASFSRALLQIPEHTWGLDEKTHLADYDNYEAARFRAVRNEGRFAAFAASWAEQRAYIQEAVAALGETELAREAREGLRALTPVRPSGLGAVAPAGSAVTAETEHVALTVDPVHGTITRLINKATGRRLASPAHTLALVQYQTFSQADYERFWRQYVINKRVTEHWARPDLTKPGLERTRTEQRVWLPRVDTIHHQSDATEERVIVALRFAEECHMDYGCPELVTVEIALPHAAPRIEVICQWFAKPACRLPEALWLSFNPIISDIAGWTMQKMGRAVTPLDVVSHGNRALHAVESVSYRDERGGLAIELLDAPLIAPGRPSLLDYSDRQPAMSKGMHVNLYNNVWGTNFPMWYDEDARFRFVLTLM